MATTNVEKLCHQVNARRREKHEILLSDYLVTIAVDRWRAQLYTNGNQLGYSIYTTTSKGETAHRNKNSTWISTMGATVNALLSNAI
jgi:hypothetical protein